MAVVDVIGLAMLGVSIIIDMRLLFSTGLVAASVGTSLLLRRYYPAQKISADTLDVFMQLMIFVFVFIIMSYIGSAMARPLYDE